VQSTGTKNCDAYLTLDRPGAGCFVPYLRLTYDGGLAYVVCLFPSPSSSIDQVHAYKAARPEMPSFARRKSTPSRLHLSLLSSPCGIHQPIPCEASSFARGTTCHRFHFISSFTLSMLSLSNTLVGLMIPSLFSSSALTITSRLRT